MISAGIIFAFFLLLVMAIAMSAGGYGKKPQHKKRRSGAVSIDKAEIQQKWQEITSVAAIGGASQLKSAVIDADKLVEKILVSRGFAGNTFAERLKTAKSKFSNVTDYDNLWYAHKVRNGIAHDNGVDFSASSAKKALGYFEKALKILGAL